MVNAQVTVAIEWLFCSIAFLFLILRIWVRVAVSKIGIKAEDSFLIIAQCMFFIWVSLDTYSISVGFMDGNASYYDDQIFAHVQGDDDLKISVLKVTYASSIPFYLCIWFIKFGILGFYYRLVPRNTRHRTILHLVTTTLIITLIVIIFINLFLCQPVSSNWSLDTSNKCYSSTSTAPFIFSALANVVTDIMVFAIPFPLIPTLKSIPKRQRVGLIVTFSLGAVTITVFVVRIIVIAISAVIALSAILSAVECGTAMVVACLPAFRILLKKRVNKLKDLSKRSAYFEDVELDRENLSPVLNNRPHNESAPYSIDTGYTKRSNNNILSNEKMAHFPEGFNKKGRPLELGPDNDQQYDEILNFDDNLYSAPVMEFPYKNPTLSQVSIRRPKQSNMFSAAVPYDPRQRFQRDQKKDEFQIPSGSRTSVHTQFIYNARDEAVEFDDEIDDSDSNLDNEEVDFSLHSTPCDQRSEYDDPPDPRMPFQHQLDHHPEEPLQQQQHLDPNQAQYTGILVLRTSFEFDSRQSTETDN